MADGSIRVNTNIDTEDAQKDLKGLEKMCQRTGQNIKKISENWSEFGSAKGINKAQTALSELERKMAALRAEINRTQAEINNGDYGEGLGKAEATKYIQERQAALNVLSEQYKKLSEDINTYSNELQKSENMKNAATELNEANIGTAFLNGITSIEQYNTVLAETRNRMQQIKHSAETIAKERGVDVNSLLEANNEYKKLDERLQLLIKHQKDFKSSVNNSFAKATKAADKFGNSIQDGVKKLARYTLAIFGARSAFMAVKQIMQGYISENEALTNSIAGIKGALGEMLGPAIQRIINLAQTAMAYVNAFVKALTGIDYVAKYNAKALDKQTSSTNSLAKAQERQSAGFDEQTKLNDTSSSGGSSGVSSSSTGGLELPTLSDETLKKIQDFADKLKNVWKWVKNNKEELLNMASAVGVAFGLLALTNWLTKLEQCGGVLGGIPDKLKLVAGALLIGGGAYLITDAIKDIIEKGPTCKNILELLAGAISLVAGIFLLLNTEMGKNLALKIKDIAESAILYAMYGVGGVKMLAANTKAWVLNNAEMLKTLGMIALVTAGIALIIAGVSDFIVNGPTLKNTILIIGGAIAIAVGLATGGISVLISAIVGAVAAIGAFVVAIMLEEPAIKTVKDAQEDLNAAKERAAEAEDNYISAVDASESALKNLKEAEQKAGMSGEALYKKVQSGTLDYADLNEAQKELYKAYIDNEKKQKDLKDTTAELNKAKQAEKMASFENQLALAKESGSYDEYKKSVISAFKNGELSADQARELIGKSMSEMSTDAQKTFMKDLPSDIKNGLDPKQYMTTRQKIGNWFSDTWKSCKDVFKNVGAWFKGIFSEAWEKVKECFSHVGAFFSSVWKIIKGVFTKIGTTVGNAIGGAFKKVVNSIINFAENTINGFIRAINAAIKLINKIPGVNISTLTELSIPRLAKGGIVNNPGRGVTAVVGEAGAEAVLPLEKNTEWMNMLADKINGGTVTVPVYLDSKLIARYVIDRKKKMEFATNGGVL